jgi:hypothetical protein
MQKNPSEKTLSPLEQQVEKRREAKGITRAAALAEIRDEERKAQQPAALPPPPVAEASTAEPPAIAKPARKRK